MKETARFECPECEKKHFVDLRIDGCDDGDILEEEVTCVCGCIFEASAELEIEYDFYNLETKVLTSGIKKKPFDIMDTSTWDKENNPNQLSLL